MSTETTKRPAHRAFPTVRFHASLPPVTVHCDAELARLGDEWADSPVEAAAIGERAAQERAAVQAADALARYEASVAGIVERLAGRVLDQQAGAASHKRSRVKAAIATILRRVRRPQSHAK